MTIATDWPTQLIPLTNQSPDMVGYVAAIASMWDEVEQYFADPDNGVVSWQALMDVDIAPLAALTWLAQCVGERLPVGLTADASRAWIYEAPNWSRGTEAGIVSAVKRLLTGTQTVQYGSRIMLDGTPNPDYIAIVTYASETPDEQSVRNTLRHYVPFDIVWQYEVLEQATWELVQAGMADWTQLEQTYGPTWQDVSGAKPGYNVW